MEGFFDKIASRYGIGPEALADAWNKTAGGSHEDHVKKFKMYLNKLTSEAHFNFEVPKMDEKVSESIAQEMLKAEFALLKEAIIEAFETPEY